LGDEQAREVCLDNTYVSPYHVAHGSEKQGFGGPVASGESSMTYTDFLRLFPDSGACLDYLRDEFYAPGTACPKCGKASKFHRVTGRSAYACQYCRHQVYPTAGTIFHKSTTSLQLWFWAIFLMSSTRCGISAKQLEREIGVTYKTAHRMFKQIRSLLTDDSEPLSGDVEAEETYYGGKPRVADMARHRAQYSPQARSDEVGRRDQDAGLRDGRVLWPRSGDGHSGQRGPDAPRQDRRACPTRVDDLHRRIQGLLGSRPQVQGPPADNAPRAHLRPGRRAHEYLEGPRSSVH